MLLHLLLIETLGCQCVFTKCINTRHQVDVHNGFPKLRNFRTMSARQQAEEMMYLYSF